MKMAPCVIKLRILLNSTWSSQSSSILSWTERDKDQYFGDSKLQDNYVSQCLEDIQFLPQIFEHKNKFNLTVTFI